MKGWLLLLVFLIWLRLTLGLTLELREGFDANFKRLIPIDLDATTLTIPSTINNALTFDTITLINMSSLNNSFNPNTLKTTSLNASYSTHTTLNASSLNVSSLTVGSKAVKMTCPGDTLLIEGPLNMASLQTSSLIVQGVLQMGGWNIHTDDHLHIRKGQGTQIGNDGNIHLDNRGWVSDIMTGVLNDRSYKIQKERERRAEIARQIAEAAKRAADEAARRAREAWDRARSWSPW